MNDSHSRDFRLFPIQMNSLLRFTRKCLQLFYSKSHFYTLLLASAYAQATPNICHKLLGAGAVVVVKESARRTPNIEALIPSLPAVGLSVYLGQTIPLDGAFAAEPGSKLTVLRGPHRLDDRIHVVKVRSEEKNLEGFVYLREFKKFTEIQTPVVVLKSAKPKKPQFPKDLRQLGYAPNNAVPKIGDIVWSRVHTGLLAPSNVGKITGLSKPGNRELADIEALDGSTITSFSDELLLMPNRSLLELVAHYDAKKIKVSWLQEILESEM